MNINIFGSTGNIGTKTLSIIKNNFPFIQVNLLLANKNYKNNKDKSLNIKMKIQYINIIKVLFFYW